MLASEEVCKILGVSISTLRRLVIEGAVPAYKIRGQLRYKQEEIEQYIASCRVKAALHVQPVTLGPHKRGRGRPVNEPVKYYPGMKVV